jgi:hypothetical protein
MYEGQGGVNLDSKWQWSALRLNHFTPGDSAFCIQWIRGWTDPRAGLGAVEETQIPCPCPESNPESEFFQSEN